MLEKLPLYSEALLDELDAAYGSYLPSPSTPEEMLWFRLGQRSIVDQLKRALEASRENVLNDV